jgi:hypothetical protein
MLWPAHSRAVQAEAVFDALMVHSNARSTVLWCLIKVFIAVACFMRAFCVLWSFAVYNCTETMLCIHDVQASAALPYESASALYYNM